MAKINIVIADSDELYLNHLTNYLIEHMNTFEVCSFTSKDSLIKYVGDKSNKIDIIAFTEDLMDGTISVANVPAKILLSDGSFTELEFESVNKFQKAEKFINDILMIYAEKTGRVEAVSTGDKDTKIVGFFSPVGGAGKTTLAVATAYALASQGKRVFYLNAEKINSTYNVLNEGNSGSLSDLYLTVKTKGANIGLRIIANKFTDVNTNISYINPSESSLEINELTLEEFEKLIKEFEQLREFDVVIVDFDSEFNKDKIEILNCMDRIIVPFTSENLSLAKTGLFIKELGMYDELKEIAEKSVFVLNKSNAQSIPALQSSGALGNCEVRANIAITPVFADLKNLLHSGNMVLQVMAKVIETI